MIYRILITIGIAIIIGCASVSSPLGGIKDEINPVLISSNPQNQSINFDKKEIALEFSEWIKLDQLDKELIITPTTEVTYKYTNKKTEFKLIFDDKLADSTTYTLNFRNGIKDITEGNVWKDSRIAFSTGNYLDSMQVEGNIRGLFNDQPAQAYLVGLYPSNIDTANLRQGKPLYLTSTDEKGNFSITNIKSGKYLLYAFSDNNDNLINNSASESYAYYNKPLTLTDSAKSVAMKSYFSNEDTLAIKNRGPSGKDYKISINKPLEDYTVSLVDTPKQYLYTTINTEQNEILIYGENFPDLKTDSVQSILSIKDSIGQTISDTFYISFRESKIKNESIKILEKPLTDITSGEQKFIFKLNKPVYTVNYDSIYIGLHDSIITSRITDKDLQFTERKNSFTITTNLNKTEIDSLINFHEQSILAANQDTSLKKQDSIQLKTTEKPTLTPTIQLRPKLYIKKGAITSIEGDSLGTQQYTLQFKNIEDYGTIEGKITDTTSNYIVQLLTEKYLVKESQYTRSNYKFNYVKPGQYRIRVIRDSNNNNKWDAGNPLTLKQYEDVFHYKDLIIVKANWEILDINIAPEDGVQSVDN